MPRRGRRDRTELSRASDFVIQEHHARRLHYDFRLERDGVLVSWAVPKGAADRPEGQPSRGADRGSPAGVRHVRGQHPQGEYGGGKVTIWDSGTYRLHKWREGKEVIVTLFGQPGRRAWRACASSP